MSDALKKALRDEMFSVLNEGELTPARCSVLMRLADHGRELLALVVDKPMETGAFPLEDHIGETVDAKPRGT
jgi:hypothetical protein